MDSLLNRNRYNMIFAFSIIILSSCSVHTHLADRENAFGTGGLVGSSFHRLADRDKGVTLAFPGYIVGIEKARWRKIGAPSGRAIKDGAYGRLGYNENVAKWKDGTMSYQEREILDDMKPTFVSTIVEYDLEESIIPHIVHEQIYNAYDSTDLVNPIDAYYEGYNALDKFGDQLIRKIKSDNITHVFVMSMGWNSDQQESIRNYNSLMIKLLGQARGQKNFRPLFVGFTWPSYWTKGGWNPISYFNKSNDADEVGMVAFNLLLNKKLLSFTNDLDFKTIVLGHSFGAKLTSRAVMSAGMLPELSKRVDLLINLESAYSINRYSVGRGAEKTESYEQWNKYAQYIALIWSDHDTAVKASFFAPLAGSSKAERRVTLPRSRDKYHGIDPVNYTHGGPLAFDKDEQILLINGSEIIYKPAYEKGGGAHSDMYNIEVAEMIWKLVKSATF